MAKASGKERRGKRKRDGQVEVERQEARIRAERLNTSQHGKEETRLTRIRDINERTATRVGDLGLVGGRVHVVMGARTQDTRAPRGGDHGGKGGDPGGIGGRTGHHGVGQGRGDPGMLLERGCLGGREPWAVLGEGADPEGKRNPVEREAQEKASPVPSSFTMPSPSALFCLSNALRSRTLRGRKGRWEGGLRSSSRAPQRPPAPTVAGEEPRGAVNEQRSRGSRN